VEVKKKLGIVEPGRDGELCKYRAPSVEKAAGSGERERSGRYFLESQEPKKRRTWTPSAAFVGGRRDSESSPKILKRKGIIRRS